MILIRCRRHRGRCQRHPNIRDGWTVGSILMCLWRSLLRALVVSTTSGNAGIAVVSLWTFAKIVHWAKSHPFRSVFCNGGGYLLLRSSERASVRSSGRRAMERRWHLSLCRGRLISTIWRNHDILRFWKIGTRICWGWIGGMSLLPESRELCSRYLISQAGGSRRIVVEVVEVVETTESAESSESGDERSRIRRRN